MRVGIHVFSKKKNKLNYHFIVDHNYLDAQSTE